MISGGVSAEFVDQCCGAGAPSVERASCRVLNLVQATPV